jgi:hypothetical protein
MNRYRATLSAAAAMVAAAAWGQVPLTGVEQPDAALNPQEVSQSITSLQRAIKESYVFPDTAERLAGMLREKQARGDYARISSARQFAERVTGDLAAIARDKHLRVFYSASALPPLADPKPGDSPLAPDTDHEEELRQQRQTNFGFWRVERLPGNIGLLKLNMFADVAACADRIIAAMAFLADTDALIIDLTDNHGGSPGTVQLLASYFFAAETPVHLNDLAWRQMGTKSEELNQWWTLMYVPGKRYLGAEVYILTSHTTFSAAEEFTYDLQAQKRAAVVGEMTGGGANPGSLRRLSDHYLAFIPSGHAINPVTKTNWEGRGIVPDLQVPQAAAFKTAYRRALERLLRQSPDQQSAEELKRALLSLSE